MTEWDGGTGTRGDGWLCVSSSSQRIIETQGLAVILICTSFLKVARWGRVVFFGKSQLKALAGKVHRAHLKKKKK